jgi:cytochrome b6-f complex iron-sulfur subunit
MPHRSNRNFSSRRRTVLYVGSLMALWPLFRFLSHKIPRKPKIVEISGTLQNNTFLAKEDFILFGDNENLWAVSRTCTHLGCRLNFIEDKNYLECPCHQSRFSPNGLVLKGPAKNPLPRYPVERTADTTYLVTIT